MAGGAKCGFEMLGRPTLVGPGGARVPLRSKQVAAALAFLWDEGRPVRREELAELFWGEERLPDHWAGAVRGVVAKARAALERAGFDRSALQVEGGTVNLHVPAGSTTDLTEAIRLAERADRALQRGELAQARDLARDAAARLAEPVAVQGEGDWIRRLHRRVAAHAGAARRTEIQALIGMGRHSEAAARAEAAIVADPLDEVAHELLVEVHLAAGRPVAARVARTDLARILHEELGIEPDSTLATARPVGEPAAQLRPLRPPPGAAPNEFFGRVQELADLHRDADEVAASGRPAVVVVEGPAGIGKTRLVQAFLEQREARQLWGRCHVESGVAFEPFADAFHRALAHADSPAALSGGSARAGLARLLPELADPAPVASVGDDRAAVVRDVVRTVATWTAGDLLVLVIDDVQWASGDTVALISRVLEDADAPVLVVLTVRTEAAEPGALAEVLRAAPATVLPLTGIAADDLLPLADDLLRLTGGDWQREGLAHHLRERTGGLPYYVTELARDVRRRGSLDATAIPEPVRAWVRRRVEALPDDLVGLLEIAAVIGARPAVELVEACGIGSSERVVAGLERLVRTGLLVETASPDNLAFAHQITREVVESGIGSTRRARLHGRVAAVLTVRGGAEPPHALLAHHLSLAGPDRSGAAVLHGFQAAAGSLARGGWDLADDQLTAALARCPGDEPILRASLLVALGRTRHVRGRPDEAVAFLDEAVELASQHRLPHHLARAALQVVGRGGRGAALGMDDAHRVAQLRRALDAATTWEVPLAVPTAIGFEVDAEALATLRTALEVELAWALLFTGSLEERRSLVEGTLARARREKAGPSRLARALVAQRNVLQGPGDLATRLGHAEEVLALPDADLSADALMAAHLGRHEDLLGLGDRMGARAALEAAHAVADRHGHPYWRWAVATWQSLWQLIDGDPAAAETALLECAALQPAGSPEVMACQAVQLVAIRLFQGRAGEVLGGVAVSAEAFPEIPCYRAVWALCLAHAGDLDGAEEAYRPFADTGFASVPVDSNRLLALAALGDVAAALGDAEGAARLDAALAPDDHLHVLLNCYGGGGAYWGPVSRIRGLLATVQGRRADAEAAFERAVVAANLLGAPLPPAIPGLEAYAQSARRR